MFICLKKGETISSLLKVLTARENGEEDLEIPHAASPLGISGSAAKTSFRAPTRPPATQTRHSLNSRPRIWHF